MYERDVNLKRDLILFSVGYIFSDAPLLNYSQTYMCDRYAQIYRTCQSRGGGGCKVLQITVITKALSNCIASYNVKKVRDFPVPSQDVINHTLSLAGNNLIISLPGTVR